MVFLNTTVLDALRWKTLDPHFRVEPKSARDAPSPDARFPPTDQGWADAMAYARSKT